MTDRRNLKLFTFFRDVALRYQETELGITQMSPSRTQALSIARSELQSAYGRQDAVDYSDPDRLIAYVLHFAPKHAVIWRELAGTYEWRGKSGKRWLWNDVAVIYLTHRANGDIIDA